ncbi:MAG: outer membrane beta-barrel protein [Candidatus Eisenbacteria bacterium]|nr:outer membrane beta-barrel protein [Candidatus Eisenbacteria bacterium]
MFRKATLLSVLASLALLAPMAHAAKGDVKITLGGGAGIPMGDFSKKVADGGAGGSLGFTSGLAVDYMVTSAVAIGVDGNYTSNNLNSDERDLVRTGPPADPTFDVKYTQIGGGAHVKYWFPMTGSKLAPYVVGGAGVTSIKGKITSNDPTLAGETSKSKFGGHGGLGVSYQASEMVGVGVEATYHFISTDKADFGTSSIQWVGVSAAVTIGMAKGGK